ncbi:hypothetical protein R0137_11045 [Congregibacter brevis]|uniref:Uncharacterized protein n=1 Tax=Congregibacter brevis TaxID=3081201 RepID=A0ABZ0I9L1_9GAMM|nr:hypothetical protein R0137_11045 [Congregibacter sp. IMCC45268]
MTQIKAVCLARTGAVIIASAVLAACSSLPEVTASYYLPQVQLALSVTQTASCSSTNVPYVVTSAKLTPIYRADLGHQYAIDIGVLDAWYSSGTATLKLHDDGRLKSINAEQEGGGGTLVQSLVDVLQAAGLSNKMKRGGREVDDPIVITACQELATMLSGGQKSLTIVHYGTTDVASNRASFGLQQDRLSPDQYAKVAPIFGDVGVDIDATKTVTVPHRYRETSMHDALAANVLAASLGAENPNMVILREPTRAEVTFVVNRRVGQWTDIAEVDIPQHGVLYALPIKSAPVFGKNVFELTLSDSGRVSSLKYSGGGAGSSVAAGFTPVLEALGSKTTSEQAAEVKAEADLIYQQQRLVVCLAKPDECPG